MLDGTQAGSLRHVRKLTVCVTHLIRSLRGAGGAGTRVSGWVSDNGQDDSATTDD
jgi:hypothetical protein